MTKAVGEYLSFDTGRPPGFLLAPFGWAAERLASMLQHEPSLLAEVLHISRGRMHLLALAFAHFEGDAPPSLGPASPAQVLLRGSAGEILDAVIGHRPAGFKRVIDRLPHRVLAAQSYRRLVQLLGDLDIAMLLHHASEIDDSTIRLIDTIPAPLRSVVLFMQAWFGRMDSLPDGLRYLVGRSTPSDSELFIAELASVRQPGQIIAKMKGLVEALPLPDALPAVRAGHARRLDHASEIRSLAKRWRNCLDHYVWNVDNGRCFVYLWEDADVQAACSVQRHGRLGWFLDEAKGPRNAELEPPRLEAIRKDFESAGLPHCSIIEAVETIAGMDGIRLRRRRRLRIRRDEQPDEDLLLDLA